MLTNRVLKGVLFMADEMLAAGAKELKDTPENEDPIETIARIYTAMELVRVLAEAVEEQRGLDPKTLN